ncbi:uncharacterized protein [Cicer arietinum]|uniref:uncharacterized protein n=1 Tax=Cicer arietinum TaxID=3827 RepID=UPI003CC6A339
MSHHEPSFKYYRNEIKMENPKALRWIDNIPPEQWTMAYSQGRRWGHMTTNISESINAMLKGTRNLPITALVHSTYYRLRVLYAERGQQHQASLASGRVYTDNCMDKIKCEVGKSNTHQVMQFDRNHYSFMAIHVPCSHVITACSYARQNYLVLISDVYKVVNVFNIYKEEFPPIPNEGYWPTYEGETLYHNPQMRRNKKGRPNSTRIRTEMDVKEKVPRKCGLCRLTGHTRKHCPNVTASSSQLS